MKHAHAKNAAPKGASPYYPPPSSHATHTVTPVVRGTNAWEIGLFGCFCAPVHAFGAACVPCLSAAYVAHYIQQSAVLAGLYFFAVDFISILFAAVPPESEHKFNPWLAVALGGSGLFLAGVMVLRHGVRMYYRIPGSVAKDCCASMLCSCCALAQMSAHTERFQDRSSSTLPAYDRRFEGETDESLRNEGDHVDGSRVDEGYHAME